MRKIVVGIGNPYLGDDAIGIRAAQIAAELYNIDATFLHTTSLEVIDAIDGYDRAVIVDSIFGDKPGNIHVFSIEDLEAKSVTCTHAIGLAETLRIGAEIIDMPEIIVVAVEIRNVDGKELSKEVMDALPIVVDVIGYELCYR